MDAGTTKAIRPPRRSKLAVTTRKGAQELVKPEKETPILAHKASARARTPPLNVW